MDLKEHKLLTRDEPTSPDLQPALGTPMFDKTPTSEIRPMNVLARVTKDLEDDEDSLPLIWKIKNPTTPPAFDSVRDQIGIEKEKEKVAKDTQFVHRGYSTRRTHKKLLSDVIEASKSKATEKRKLRSTTVLDTKEARED